MQRPDGTNLMTAACRTYKLLTKGVGQLLKGTAGHGHYPHATPVWRAGSEGRLQAHLQWGAP